MDIDKQIRELEAQLKHLKNIRHNMGMNGAAEGFIRNLKDSATDAELKFMEIARAKKIKLEFQYKIDVYDRDGRIKQFFIVDFCDVIHRIVFEVDGEYHNTKEQQKKDWMRTKILNRLGYRVFRISNSDVFAGKSTSLLYSAHPNLAK